MALIKCTECGHEVSDKAQSCPNCGCPIEKSNCCVECGQPIPEGVSVCPNCGCPTQDNHTHHIESPKKSKSGLIWLISILVLSVLLGCGYYFYNKTNGTSGEEVNEIRIDSLLEKEGNEVSSEQQSIEANKEIERRAIVGTYYFNPRKDNNASVDMYDGQRWWKERKLIGYINWAEYLVVMDDLRVSLLEPNRKRFVGNVTDIENGAFVISVNSSENATVGAWTPLYKNGREIGRLGDKGYGFPKNIVIDTKTRRIYNGVNDYMNRDISDVEYIMYDRYSSTIEDSNNTEYERTYLSEKYEREYGR